MDQTDQFYWIWKVQTIQLPVNSHVNVSEQKADLKTKKPTNVPFIYSQLFTSLCTLLVGADTHLVVEDTGVLSRHVVTVSVLGQAYVHVGTW